jgi:hypothetical protein
MPVPIDDFRSSTIENSEASILQHERRLMQGLRHLYIHRKDARARAAMRRVAISLHKEEILDELTLLACRSLHDPKC